MAYLESSLVQDKTIYLVWFSYNGKLETIKNLISSSTALTDPYTLAQEAENVRASFQNLAESFLAAGDTLYSSATDNKVPALQALQNDDVNTLTKKYCSKVMGTVKYIFDYNFSSITPYIDNLLGYLQTTDYPEDATVQDYLTTIGNAINTQTSYLNNWNAAASDFLNLVNLVIGKVATIGITSSSPVNDVSDTVEAAYIYDNNDYSEIKDVVTYEGSPADKQKYAFNALLDRYSILATLQACIDKLI